MLLDDSAQLVDISAEESAFLIHELMTHQIELELQNDELIKTQDELGEKNLLLTELYDMAPAGYLTTNKKGMIIRANLAIADLLGLDRESLLNCALSDFIASQYQDNFYLHQQNVNKTREKQGCELLVHTEAGDAFWINLETIGVKSSKKMYEKFRHVITDISQRKLAEEKTLLLTEAITASPSAFILTDSRGTIEYVNPKYTEITGYTELEAIGQNAGYLKSGETSDSTYVDIWKQINTNGKWQGRLHNRKKDGSLFWAQIAISRFVNSDDDITHYIGTMEDVTRLSELSDELSFQASHDNLTGLINRGEFERRTRLSLNALRGSNDKHALCYIDLDQFKVVNDTCGHLAGDEMLRRIGSLLQDSVRQHDILGRLGGDEFGLLILNCSLKNALLVVEHIINALDGFQFLWEAQSFWVTASIGMIEIDKNSLDFTQLMKRADAACYLAKDAGRNRIHVHHLDDKELAERVGEMSWVTSIQQALEKDNFILYAQPIFSLASYVKPHYELLIRMKGEHGDIIPPGAFLPAAERYNLIEKIDLWVLNTSFDLLENHPEFVQQIEFVSINISGPTLTNQVFLQAVVEKFKANKIDANKICFEITETAAIANLNSAINFISRLKAIGCRFALDDFGTGLSSFSYLKNMPTDYLKIDGAFVKNIVNDPIDRAMVKSINEIGHVMGMLTIAEFVENDEIKEVLKEIGVDCAQGFGLGKPEPFLALLEASRDTPLEEIDSSNSR